MGCGASSQTAGGQSSGATAAEKEAAEIARLERLVAETAVAEAAQPQPAPKKLKRSATRADKMAARASEAKNKKTATVQGQATVASRLLALKQQARANLKVRNRQLARMAPVEAGSDSDCEAAAADQTPPSSAIPPNINGSLVGEAVEPKPTPTRDRRGSMEAELEAQDAYNRSTIASIDGREYQQQPHAQPPSHDQAVAVKPTRDRRASIGAELEALGDEEPHIKPTRERRASIGAELEAMDATAADLQSSRDWKPPTGAELDAMDVSHREIEVHD